MIATKTLQKFCSEPYSLFWIERPFRWKDRIVATDGAIIVFIPDDGRRLCKPKLKLPNVARIWERRMVGATYGTGT